MNDALIWCMKRFRSALFLALGLAIGLSLGWSLRGRSFAAKEAMLGNMIQFEKAKQQWEAEAATNVTAPTRR
jgi:hypothetical protein